MHYLAGILFGFFVLEKSLELVVPVVQGLTEAHELILWAELFGPREQPRILAIEGSGVFVVSEVQIEVEVFLLEPPVGDQMLEIG